MPTHPKHTESQSQTNQRILNTISFKPCLSRKVVLQAQLQELLCFICRLMENPANYMTPTKFTQMAQLKMPDSCEVIVRVRLCNTSLIEYDRACVSTANHESRMSLVACPL